MEKTCKAEAKVVPVPTKSLGDARDLSASKNETRNLCECCEMSVHPFIRKQKGRRRQRARKRENVCSSRKL